MRIAVLFCPVLLIALTHAMARADGSDPTAADVRFREGRRAAEAGNYAVACPKFEESYRLDPAQGTLLNLADCEENRGQLVRAGQHFRQLYDQLPTTDERKPLADTRARALERRASKLRIVLTTTVPTHITRDDVVLGPATLGTNLALDPGRHVIVVTAPGRREKHFEVLLRESEEQEISVFPGEPLVDPSRQGRVLPVLATDTKRSAAVPVLTPEPSRAPAGEGRSQRTAAFVLGGVGLASFVTGSIFGAAALSLLASSNAGCTGNVCSSPGAVRQFHDAQSFAIAADVTIGVGLVLIGTAVVLALTVPHRSATSAVSPLPIWMGGRF